MTSIAAGCNPRSNSLLVRRVSRQWARLGRWVWEPSENQGQKSYLEVRKSELLEQARVSALALTHWSASFPSAWFLSTSHPTNMKRKASTSTTLPFVTLDRRDSEVVLDRGGSVIKLCSVLMKLILIKTCQAPFRNCINSYCHSFLFKKKNRFDFKMCLFICFWDQGPCC